MRTKAAVLGLLLAALGAGPALAGGASPQKLSRIRRELARKREALERYQKQCDDLERRMGAQAKKLADSRSERGRLEALHRAAAAEKLRLRADLRSLEGGLKGLASKTGGMANLYYVRSLLSEPFFGRYELLSSAVMEQNLTQDLGRWQFMQSRRDEVSGKALEADRKAGDLRAQAQRQTQREKTARLKLEARQKQLEEARGRLARTRRELDDLEASAKEMDRLLARLAERTAQRRSAARAQAKEPPVGAKWPRHSLPWPAEGRVVSAFGRQRVEAVGAWILNRGIRMATAPGESVATVQAGQVIYAGNFRTYGRVVIVEHAGGWVSVYGQLGSLAKAAGDSVKAGDVLGTAGDAKAADARLAGLPGDKSSLYFEIRRGSQAVDPLKWLQKK